MAITTTTTGRGKRWQPQLFAFTKNFSTFSCYPLVFFVLQHGHRHRPTEQIVNEKVFMLFSVCRGRNRRLALSFFAPSCRLCLCSTIVVAVVIAALCLLLSIYIFVESNCKCCSQFDCRRDVPVLFIFPFAISVPLNSRVFHCPVSKLSQFS